MSRRMEIDMSTQTKKCVRCGKPAEMWCGYVEKRSGIRVEAGWCSKRCADAWIGRVGRFVASEHGEERIAIL